MKRRKSRNLKSWQIHLVNCMIIFFFIIIFCGFAYINLRMDGALVCKEMLSCQWTNDIVMY